MTIATRTRSQYNFDKCEFNDMRLPASWEGKNFTSPRQEAIQFVVMHHMVIRDTDPNDDEALAKCREIWATRPAAAGYGVDNDFIAQFVSDNDAAYATADRHGNHGGVSIEMVNKTLDEPGTANDYIVADLTWKTAAKLAAYLHKLYKLGRPVKDKTLRKHSSFFATACPGPYITNIWDAFVKEAQRVYDGIGLGSTSPVPNPPAEVPIEEVTYLSILHWNVAGSDVVNGYAASNHYRGDEVGAWAKAIGFEVFMTCEAGQSDLRRDISKGLGPVVGVTEWMQRAKAIWFTPKVKNISARKVYSADPWSYLSTRKWGAAFFGAKNGKKFAALEIHTDYRQPAKQAKQVEAIFRKFRKDCDALGIKHTNQYVLMDGNWDGTAGDNPFKALSAWNFHEKGDRDKNTFMERKHLDGVLAHREANVHVSVRPRIDTNGWRLSDHNPVKMTAELD